MSSPFSRTKYYRSKNRHERSARNEYIDTDEFHSRVKALKPQRENVRSLLWKWLDPNSRESVDEAFRKYVEDICTTGWYFEQKLGFISPATTTALEDLRRVHKADKKKLEGEKRALENEKLRIEKEKRELESKYQEKVLTLEQRLEDAQTDNKKLSERGESYRKQIQPLHDEITALEDKIKMSEFSKDESTYIAELEKLQSLLKEKDNIIQRSLTENNQMKTVNVNLTEDHNKAKETIAKLSSENGQIQKENENMKKENENVKKENENMKKDLNETDEKMARLWQDLEKVKQDLNLQKKENSDLKNRIHRLREEEANLCSTIDKLQEHLSAEKHAKEEALTRLSAAAANKLRDNNPGITDLSDPNRPMKLAEKISELYDNEWTNAMENMEDHGIEEEEGVQILLEMLTTVFLLCKDGGDRVMSSIENYIAVPAIDGIKLGEIKVDGLPKLQPEFLKPLKDFRKATCVEVIAFIKGIILDKIKKTDYGKKDHVMEDCSEFIDKTIEYCWLMHVQDPPVHIEWNFSEGSDFDTNKFKSYTRGGNLVKFVVWPVLYLYENGPLLSKGVVQGRR